MASTGLRAQEKSGVLQIQNHLTKVFAGAGFAVVDLVPQAHHHLQVDAAWVKAFAFASRIATRASGVASTHWKARRSLHANSYQVHGVGLVGAVEPDGGDVVDQADVQVSYTLLLLLSGPDVAGDRQNL